MCGWAMATYQNGAISCSRLWTWVTWWWSRTLCVYHFFPFFFLLLFLYMFYVAAICDPPCQNSGTCVGFNVCQCSPNYKGSRCEYGNVVMNYSLELGEYLCSCSSLKYSQVSRMCVRSTSSTIPFYLLTYLLACLVYIRRILYLKGWMMMLWWCPPSLQT